MSNNTTFRGNIADAVIKYFKGTDFHLTLKNLSDATSDRLYSILKDCSMDDDDAIREVTSEVWHITEVMAFLAELYHWNMMIEKYPETG
jgi:hypothetical protein